MKREVNMRHQCVENVKDKENTKPRKEGIVTDPFGSWTGVVNDDIHDKPVQDVDDL